MTTDVLEPEAEEEVAPVYRERETGAIVDACEVAVGIEVRTVQKTVVTEEGQMLTYHPELHGYLVWDKDEFFQHYEEVLQEV